jgi:hypothetical protein
LFYVVKNVLSDKATMSKNKYANLYLKYCTWLPFLVCLNTCFLFLDIPLCALLISQPSITSAFVFMVYPTTNNSAPLLLTRTCCVHLV